MYAALYMAVYTACLVAELDRTYHPFPPCGSNIEMSSKRHKLLGEDDAVGAPTRRWESPRRGASGEMAAAHGPRDRVYECRTCGRRFPTYQALGGHRASHGRHLPSVSRPRPGDGVGVELRLLEPRGGEARPRTHGCPVCGVEFAVGQALGGHMKRHRAMADADANAHGTRAATSVKDDGVGDECTAEICLDLNLAQAENCAKCRNAGAGDERLLRGGNP